MQILQTTGDNFRRARTAEIYQDNDRHPVHFIAMPGGAVAGILAGVAALG